MARAIFCAVIAASALRRSEALLDQSLDGDSTNDYATDQDYAADQDYDSDEEDLRRPRSTKKTYASDGNETDSSSAARSAVAMVNFDSNYISLFECWSSAFFNVTSNRRLEVITLDAKATEYVAQWKKTAPKSWAKAVDVHEMTTKDPTLGIWSKEARQAQAARLAKAQKEKMEKLKKISNESVASGEKLASRSETNLAARVSGGGMLTGRRVLRTHDANRDGAADQTLQHDTKSGQHSTVGWPSPYYFKAYWLALKRRLDMGDDILHMDLDAFPLRNPWSYVLQKKFTGADIVASTDSWPADMMEKWGFALNPGYILYRSTPEAKRFVDDMIYKWEHNRTWDSPDVWLGDKRTLMSEQLMMNRHLNDLGCNWTYSDPKDLATYELVKGQCGYAKIAAIFRGNPYILRKTSKLYTAAEDPDIIIRHDKRKPWLKKFCGAFGSKFQTKYG